MLLVSYSGKTREVLRGGALRENRRYVLAHYAPFKPDLQTLLVDFDYHRYRSDNGELVCVYVSVFAFSAPPLLNQDNLKNIEDPKHENGLKNEDNIKNEET